MVARLSQAITVGEDERSVLIVLVSRKLWLILRVVEGEKAVWFGAGASLGSVDLGNKGTRVHSSRDQGGSLG
jgi:hypothetical protein